VANGGGSPGRVIGAAGSMVRTAIVNGFVRQQLRPLSAKQKHEDLLTLTGLVEQGKLVSVLDQVYPLADTAKGLAPRGERALAGEGDGYRPG